MKYSLPELNQENLNAVEYRAEQVITSGSLPGVVSAEAAFVIFIEGEDKMYSRHSCMPWIMTYLEEAGHKLTNEERTDIWKCHLRGMWNIFERGGIDRDEFLHNLIEDSEYVLSKLGAEGWNPGGLLELAEFTPSFFTSGASRSKDSFVLRERDFLVPWLKKAIGKDAFSNLFYRVIFEYHSTLYSRQYMSKGDKKKTGANLAGGFVHWLGFLEEIIRQGEISLTLPLADGLREPTYYPQDGQFLPESLLSLLLPVLQEFSDSALEHFTPPENIPCPRLDKNFPNSPGGKTTTDAGTFFQNTLAKWMDELKEEFAHFRVCGDLGSFVRRGSPTPDVRRVYHALKKQLSVKKEMEQEASELLALMKILWGEQGEMFPGIHQGDGVNSSAGLYRRLQSFLLRAFSVDTAFASKFMKEYPLLSDREFLFGDEGGRQIVPEEMSALPLGPVLMTAGVSFRYKEREGEAREKMSPYELFSRIFLGSDTDEIFPHDLAGLLQNTDIPICDRLAKHIISYFGLHTRERIGRTAVLTNQSAFEWINNKNVFEHTKTRGAFYCAAAAIDSKERGPEELNRILERTELWADDFRNLFFLPSLYKTACPISKENLELLIKPPLMGFRKFSSQDGSFFTCLLTKLAVTSGEYEEIVARDERERVEESSSFSPCDPLGPWSPDFQTQTTAKLGLKDMRVPFMLIGSNFTSQWRVGQGPSFEKSASSLRGGKPCWDINDIHSLEFWTGKDPHALLGFDTINLPPRRRGTSMSGENPTHSICFEGLKLFVTWGRTKNIPDFWVRFEEHLKAGTPRMSPAASICFYRMAEASYKKNSSWLPLSVLNKPLDFQIANRTESGPVNLSSEYSSHPVFLTPSVATNDIFQENLQRTGASTRIQSSVVYLSNAPLPLWAFLSISGHTPPTLEHALLPASELTSMVMAGEVESNHFSAPLNKRIKSGLPLPPDRVWMDVYSESVLCSLDEKSDRRILAVADVDSTPRFIGEGMIRFLAERFQIPGYTGSDGVSAAVADAREWGIASAIRTLLPLNKNQMADYNIKEKFLQCGLQGLMEIDELTGTLVGRRGDEDPDIISAAAVSLHFADGWGEGMKRAEKYIYRANNQSVETEKQMEEILKNISTKAAIAMAEREEPDTPDFSGFQVF